MTWWRIAWKCQNSEKSANISWKDWIWSPQWCIFRFSVSIEIKSGIPPENLLVDLSTLKDMISIISDCYGRVFKWVPMEFLLWPFGNYLAWQSGRFFFFRLHKKASLIELQVFSAVEVEFFKFAVLTEELLSRSFFDFGIFYLLSILFFFNVLL